MTQEIMYLIIATVCAIVLGIIIGIFARLRSKDTK